MLQKIVFILLACAFFCLQAPASTTPVSIPAPVLFHDTTLGIHANNLNATQAKKTGFFSMLKNKLAVFVLGKQKSTSSTKKTLGWMSIGLFVLGFALLATGAAIASIILIPAGITTGVIALTMKGDKNNIKERRRSRWPAIIGIVLGVGLIVGLAIAFSSWR